MLATVVRDVYRRDEAGDLRRAIDDLASPRDSYGFASNGVYLFFDPTSLRICYIGLARDLSERFAQHNGLVQMSEKGCKRVQIERWFADHDELGYAMFVASSLSQASVHRQTGTPSAAYYDEESEIFVDYSGEGLDEIKATEGLLIAAYVARHNTLPPWNKIKGARTAPHLVTDGGYSLLDIATGQQDSLLLARRTIRGLSADVTAMEYEINLHTGRIGAIEDTAGTGISSPVIWNALAIRANNHQHYAEDLSDAVERIVRSRYVLEIPPPPATAATPGQMQRIPGVPDVLRRAAADRDGPAESRWQPVQVAETARVNLRTGEQPLFCRRCAAPATVSENVDGGSPAMYWCCDHAVQNGALASMISTVHL